MSLRAGVTGGTAGAQTILTLPRVQQRQIAGEGSVQTGFVSPTNTNTSAQSHTHTHTHTHTNTLVFPQLLFSIL